MNSQHAYTLTDCERLETAGYIDMQGEQLYYVLHRTPVTPKARVLMAGPFASERPHRYISWVKWARFLAENGYEALRFDYRGCGESTGKFEDYNFSDWENDIRRFSGFLIDRPGSCPVVLHGLGMGGLLAEHAFRTGTAGMLVLWLPPESGKSMLYQQLRLKIANDFVLQPVIKKTRDQYADDLEKGIPVEVEGYKWTGRLWKDAGDYILPNGPDFGTLERPGIIHELDACGRHLLGGVGPNPIRGNGTGKPLRLLNPDLTENFRSTVSWLDAKIMMKTGDNSK